MLEKEVYGRGKSVAARREVVLFVSRRPDFTVALVVAGCALFLLGLAALYLLVKLLF